MYNILLNKFSCVEGLTEQQGHFNKKKKELALLSFITLALKYKKIKHILKKGKFSEVYKNKRHRKFGNVPSTFPLFNKK